MRVELLELMCCVNVVEVPANRCNAGVVTGLS